MGYTAQQVQEALENYSFTDTFNVYKLEEPDRYGYSRYVFDENNQIVVDHVEEFQHEFSWIEAEDKSDGYVWEGTGVGDVEKVASEPGGEGHGEDIWVVVRTIDTGQLFRMNGWYASYDGSNYDGELYEVRAQERTVVVYV